MNTQNVIYLILALAAGSFVWTLIRDVWPSKRRRNPFETVQSQNSVSGEYLISLQLQAYERMVLFLERMKIDRLLQRLSPYPETGLEMRQILVQVIQGEFDHNMSQQIYLSSAAWEAICTAKEQVITMINALAQQLATGESAVTFNRRLVNQMLNQKDNPVDLALQIVNSEAKKTLTRT